MDTVWLPLAFFWLGLSVFQVVRFRKTEKPAYLIASALMLVAAGTFAFLAVQTRPQLHLTNAGKEPILVTVEGELEMERLVPTQELSTRYDVGAELTIMRATDAGPGESRSFPLPDGKNEEVFKATVRTDASGVIRVEFGSGSPK